MNCRTCGEPILAARLAAIPTAVQCVNCVVQNGDEPPLQGHMQWDHKTAPTIEIGTRLAADRPMAHPREGKSSTIGTTKCQFDKITSDDCVVVNRRRSRCHPDRPAVSPTGMCAHCALEWYSKRLR